MSESEIEELSLLAQDLRREATMTPDMGLRFLLSRSASRLLQARSQIIRLQEQIQSKDIVYDHIPDSLEILRDRKPGSLIVVSIPDPS